MDRHNSLLALPNLKSLVDRSPLFVTPDILVGEGRQQEKIRVSGKTFHVELSQN
ncbi:MAG: hypothetical protein HC820_09060 [Hydrococcus sp. RM1_1_31]|nr:hypothetical protein [Hydrococcus sp. RM1_1_31]